MLMCVIIVFTDQYILKLICIGKPLGISTQNLIVTLVTFEVPNKTRLSSLLLSVESFLSLNKKV